MCCTLTSCNLKNQPVLQRSLIPPLILLMVQGLIGLWLSAYLDVWAADHLGSVKICMPKNLLSAIANINSIAFETPQHRAQDRAQGNCQENALELQQQRSLGSELNRMSLRSPCRLNVWDILSQISMPIGCRHTNLNRICGWHCVHLQVGSYSSSLCNWQLLSWRLCSIGCLCRDRTANSLKWTLNSDTTNHFCSCG